MSFSPDGRRLWIALGEVARTVVRLDTSDLAHPRIAGRLHPRFFAHSVGFAPDGRTVWLSSARAPYVTVYDAATGTVVKVVRAGRAPQEVAFSGARALLTSGYGSSSRRCSGGRTGDSEPFRCPTARSTSPRSAARS